MKSASKIYSLMVCIYICFACSESSTDPQQETQELEWIPPIEQIWINEADPDHEFNFELTDENRNTNMGEFFGVENHSSNPDLDNNELTGTFHNAEIDFIVERPAGNVTYTGSYDTTGADIKIRFNSPQGDLVLIR